ncbi:hypothetical protein [Paenibacillus sp. YIM B09110]|uniref:hypothetical protein n=1 Tax=Paenibacillus sp. YIM B09110 TaxID=3126102 RepID=UPI00301C4F38
MSEPNNYELQQKSQYYADFNESGNIAAFYVDEIHRGNIPEAALPITFEEWQTFSANANAYKLDGETIREKTEQEIAEESTDLPLVLESTEQNVDRLENDNIATMLALAEAYETSVRNNAQREQESLDTMLALTEAYGLVIEQQATIESLTTRLEVLETVFALEVSD